MRALADPAWQLRKGTALVLVTTAGRVAIEALVAATHLEVRKAAVSSLSGWADDPDVAVTLKEDSDADVRTIARHALRAGRPER